MNASITSRAVKLHQASAAVKDQRLSQPVSLMLITATSLGLWAAIWAAGFWLVSAVVG